MKSFLQAMPAVVIFASVVSLGSVGLYRLTLLERQFETLNSEVEKQTLSINSLASTISTHLALDRLNGKGGSPMPPRP